jgi:UDP-2,4-diacetamido-2,4,6-trideoxy-beta-L-altropyranose hydrolase
MSAAGRQAVFIVAAGAAAGLGHIRRSVAVARMLRERSVASRFLVEGPADACRVASSHGLEADCWSGDAASAASHARTGNGVFVVDSYAWTSAAVATLRSRHAGRLVVFDDLGDRWLTADMVVNGGAGADRLGYGAMPVGRRLLGTRYLMLQPEFAAAAAPGVRDRVARVLILGGGGAASGGIVDLARIAAQAYPAAEVAGVVGPFAEVPQSSAGVTWYRDPPNLVELMRSADIAVSSAGQTMYELAAIGVPTVAVAAADNQVPGAEGMARSGAIRYAGLSSGEACHRRLFDLLVELGPAAGRQQQRDAARALVDGRGASRVADEMLSLMEST